MLTLRQAGWARRAALVAVTTLALIGFAAVPAGAVLRTGPNPAHGLARGANTQIVLSNTGPGESLSGYIANPGSGFDPAEGYPTEIPPPNFSSKDESFAGVIYGTPVGGGAEISLYCIDILTDTYIGYGYALGTWDEANVPNVGYVARILDEYYPNTEKPITTPHGVDLTTDQTAAAVQAAVWFFSDKYVLSTSEAIESTVAEIVDTVLSQPPIVEPPAPSLTISPSNLSGPTGSALGPYTVHSTASTTVASTGANMYSDAGATHLITQGEVVPDAESPGGQEIWLKSTGQSAAQLQATAVATVPSGNVYLYDGGANLAQKLILSKTATLTTIVNATADFEAPGSLVVQKTITGPAAGHQGAVTIHTVCNGAALMPDLTIGAGATGSPSKTYDDIPAGFVCTATETVNGSTSTVGVTVSGSGQDHTILSGSPVTANITDTYSYLPGSLTVNKVIAGSAAGSQGAVTIHAVCGSTALEHRTSPSSPEGLPRATRTPGLGSRRIPAVW